MGQKMAKTHVQTGDILHQQMVDGVCCVCFLCTKQQVTSGLGCIPKFQQMHIHIYLSITTRPNKIKAAFSHMVV